MEVRLIYRKKLSGLGWHYGVHIPQSGCVFEYQKKQGLLKSSMSDFAKGREVFIENKYPLTQANHDKLLGYIKKRQVYDLWINNCEHFARDISYGKKESLQIQGLVITLMFLFGFTALQENEK